MKLNPVLLQKALNAFSSALAFLSQAIVASLDDVKECADITRAKEAIDTFNRTMDSAKKEEDAAPKPVERKEEKAKADRLQVINNALKRIRNSQSDLPDKPMRQANMEEFLKGWLPKAKAHPVKTMGGFAAGMCCSIGGVEHVVKALYNNGVVLVTRKATQYHKLVPVEQLDRLFMKDSGKKGKYAPGQKVLVGFGMKDANKATSFRPAVLESVRGQEAAIKYLDTGAVSSAKLSFLAPVRERS